VTDPETIALLRVELAETIEQRDDLARRNEALLESHRRVYLATKPVLDAVKVLVSAEDVLPETLQPLRAAHNAYNPPRELEVYK